MRISTLMPTTRAQAKGYPVIINRWDSPDYWRSSKIIWLHQYRACTANIQRAY